MKKSIFCLCAMLIFCVSLFAGTVKTASDTSVVHIPDANFKAALVGNPAININGDAEIQVSEAQAYEGGVNVANRGISDLTGIEAFSAISSLNCDDNQLTNLDVSACPSLINLGIADNPLITLNLQNGNNANMSVSGLFPSFHCIQVDDAAWAVANWGWRYSFSNVCDGSVVYIPDYKFRFDLLQNHAINTNGDGVIQVSEAQAYDGAINATHEDIRDLTGLEAFTNIDSLSCSIHYLRRLNITANTALTYLDCSETDLTSLDVSSCTELVTLICDNSGLTSLDLSSNPALVTLDCESCRLTSLDVSSNPALVNLDCGENQLTNLDVSSNPALVNLDCGENQLANLDVSSNPALITLICEYNQITSLDVSSNPALVNLICEENNLTSLDVSSNPALINLNCRDNQITSLDVSSNPALVTLQCGHNQLTSLDISANPNLEWLRCGYNQLTDLDVSANPNLERLSCSENQLASLNVQNGNNVNFRIFGVRNNPDLSCIQVDDAAWATANWSHKVDPTAAFSTNCNALPISTCSVISAGTDDAEERTSTGVTYIVSSDIELIDDPLHGGQTVGLRFTGLDIPPGSVIENAYIQFTVDETTDVDPCNLSIYGEAADNAAAFDSINLNITTRLRTGNSVAWAPGAWSVVGEAGPDQQTPDISPVLQEIVDRTGYTSASAIVIMIEGTGRRTGASFDGVPASAPQLCVDYFYLPPPYDCPEAAAYYGDPCDDGDPDTENDVITVECKCEGNASVSSLLASPIVYLQGAYNAGAMGDDLRVGKILPLVDPYAALGYTHVGGGLEAVPQSVLDVTGPDAIVDWVFLELRDKSDAAIVLATRSALLQSDGNVVDMDGMSPVAFDDLPADDYYVVVKHRNHLGVMSAVPIALSEAAAAVDFTTDLNFIYGGVYGIATLPDGKFGLYSGDFNHNGQVQYTDYAAMILTLGTAGYHAGDFDLNGQVQNADQQFKLAPNFGRGAAFP